MPTTNSVIKPSKAVFNFVIYIILAYFIYHVLSGERGLLSYMRLSHELQEKAAMMKSLEAEKISLEKKVGLISNFDKDTLDELARQNLGLMGKDEEVWIIEDYND